MRHAQCKYCWQTSCDGFAGTSDGHRLAVRLKSTDHEAKSGEFGDAVVSDGDVVHQGL